MFFLDKLYGRPVRQWTWLNPSNFQVFLDLCLGLLQLKRAQYDSMGEILQYNEALTIYGLKIEPPLI